MKLMNRPLVDSLAAADTPETLAFAAAIEVVRFQAALFIGLHLEGYNLTPRHLPSYTPEDAFTWADRIEAMSQAATILRLITKACENPRTQASSSTLKTVWRQAGLSILHCQLH